MVYNQPILKPDFYPEFSWSVFNISTIFLASNKKCGTEWNYAKLPLPRMKFLHMIVCLIVCHVQNVCAFWKTWHFCILHASVNLPVSFHGKSWIRMSQKKNFIFETFSPHRSLRIRIELSQNVLVHTSMFNAVQSSLRFFVKFCFINFLSNFTSGHWKRWSLDFPQFNAVLWNSSVVLYDLRPKIQPSR